MVAEGRTVIFISHKLHEVKAVSDRVTVLRGGRAIATVDTASSTLESLASLMVGRAFETTARPRPPRTDEREPVLAVEGLTVEGDRGGTAVDGRRPYGARRRDRRARGCLGQRAARVGRGDHRVPAGARRLGACRAPRCCRTAMRVRRSSRGGLRPRGPARHGGLTEPLARDERRAQVVPRRSRRARSSACGR